MKLRPLMIATAAAAVLAGGLITAVAANAHGSTISKLATTTTLTGEARGDAVGALASARGEKTSDAAKAEATTDKTARDADADADAAAKTTTTSDKDAHGDSVSAVAKSDATAARDTGDKPNHGAAVSAVAKKH